MAQPTPEQVEANAKATQWIKQRTSGKLTCSACGRTTFGISDPVEMPARMTGGLVFLAVPASCQHCGFTVFFNGSQMGLGD